MQWKVPLFETDFGPAELEAVQEPVRRGWLTLGELTQELERQFAERVGVRHAFAVSNCTVGLHLCTAAAGLGPGDEVICPTLTFVATANAIKYVGATPVFADSVSEDNLNIGPEQVERCITPRTKAILVVHYAGFPVDMPGIMALAERHKLIVLEDCAHALFSRVAGRTCGAWGQSAAFSFFGNKNMTCGEGGMVTTDSDEVAEKVRLMRSHGMTTLTLDRYKGRAFQYDVVSHGYNYRLDEIRASLALAQLRRLPQFLCERQRVRDRYVARLAGSPVKVPHFDWAARSGPGDYVGHHIMPVLLPAGMDRPALAARLKEAGIQTSVHYRAVHTFSAFASGVASGPRPVFTEALADRELTLPMYPTQSDGQVDLVCEALLECL
ncbi:MAG: DegT/DnrJ/EryC1/StrS family aminotransferase [Phycisphaerales bacterium]|nr:DegT/DnrJ/EryC1/StrS family aminotransferase [Phycisphaerales bacterium]